MAIVRSSLPLLVFVSLVLPTTASAHGPGTPKPDGGGIYQVFFQGDPKWSEQSLGNSELHDPFESIGRAGCTLAALAMLLYHYGFDTVYLGGTPFPLDPSSLDLFLDVNNLYLPSGFLGFGQRRTGIAWSDIGTISSQLNYTGASIVLEHRLQSWVACDGSPLNATAAFYVNHPDDYILPARVIGSAAGCTGHQILLFKYSSVLRRWAYLDPASFGGVHDPGRPSYNRLNIVVPSSAPSPAVVTEGLPLFLHALEGGSRLSVYAAAGERILVIDPMGRRGGWDASGVWYDELPGTMEATIDPIDDASGGKDVVEPGIEGVIIEGASAGTYDVQITDFGGDGHGALVRVEDPAHNSGDVMVAAPIVSVEIGDQVRVEDVDAPYDEVRLAKCFIVPISDGLYALDHDLASGIYCELPAGQTGTGLFTVTGAATTIDGRRTLDLQYAFGLQAGPGNNHPIAASDVVSSGPAGVSVPVAELLANDSDPEMAPLSFAAAGATPETHGTLTWTPDSVRYVPDPGFEGTARFAYSITDGSGGWGIGQVAVTVAGLVAVRPEGHGLVQRIGVSPNPSRGAVSIEFELSRESQARVRVFDLAGREVAVLANGMHGEGVHRIRWGADGRLRPAAGIYFVKLEVSGESWVRRIALTD
jgi:hypothetical protein